MVVRRLGNSVRGATTRTVVFPGALFAGASSVLATLVSAQTASTADDSGGGLAEIVVTAQKRSSTVQETPISITAVSGQDLQDRGIGDVATLAAATPGVSLKSNGPLRFEVLHAIESGL